LNDIMRGTFDPNSGLASQGDDSKVFATFYTRSVVDGLASKEAGRQINKDVSYVKIIQPGESRLGTYDQPATEADVQRFPRQWQQYKANQQQTMDGSPLSLLFPDNPAIVDNLKGAGVFTVEQLATMQLGQLQQVGMGGQTFQDRAKAYLAAADKGKDFHTLAARLEQLELSGRAKDDKIAALEAALAQRTEEPARRGPGRPPKAEQAA
jgi:hypothetical protein